MEYGFGIKCHFSMVNMNNLFYAITISSISVQKLTENVPAYANFLSSIFDIAFCHYICIICQMYNGLRNQKKTFFHKICISVNFWYEPCLFQRWMTYEIWSYYLFQNENNFVWPFIDYNEQFLCIINIQYSF